MENTKEKNTIKPTVSILVPIYNVGRYLPQCLESILSQTFTDWECILVDDGSTDSSGKICDEFASKDNRFRVLHVKNGGVASARNIAVKAAEGKYIAFCDPDDWMDPECIATMYNLITTHDADIVQIGFQREFVNHSRVKHLVDTLTVYNREEALMELVKDSTVQSFLWNKMFRREVVSPDFPVGHTFEDVYICVKWFNRIKKLVCDPSPLYHYRMRQGSILHASSSKNRLDYLKAKSFRANELLRLNLPSFTLEEHDTLIAKAIVKSAKIIARKEPDKTRRKQLLKDLSHRMRELRAHGIKGLGVKLRLRSNLLASHPAAFSNLMRLVGKTDIHTNYRNRTLFP